MNFKNKTLVNVVLISLGLHIVVLFAIGSMTLYNIVVPDEVEMEAYEINEIEEQKPVHRVKLMRQQKNSQRIPLGAISIPQTVLASVASEEMDLPVVRQKLSVNNYLGGSGRKGVMMSANTNAIDMSTSSVDFFGVKSSGENIVFVVDVARSMLEPSRGDIDGFNRVKRELSRMISQLNPGTLFNICVFSSGLDVFSPKSVAATAEEKELAAKWVDDYWRYEGTRLKGSAGVRLRNYAPDFEGYPIRRNMLIYDSNDANTTVTKKELPKLHGQHFGAGSSRLDMALFAAFEMRADTIFLITDGTPQVAHAYTPDKLTEFQKDLRNWIQGGGKDSPKYLKYKEALREYYKEVAEYQRARLAKGLPMEVNEGGSPGGIKKPKVPKGIDRPVYDPVFGVDEMVAMLNRKAEDEYINKTESKLPPLHIVGYSTDKKSEAYLKELQRKFPRSRFRSIGNEDIKNYGREPKIVSNGT